MPMNRSRALVVFVGVGLAVACSDMPSVDSISGGAVPSRIPASSSGSTEEGTSPELRDPCGSFTAPTLGADCSVEAQVALTTWDFTCEYGHDILKTCNDVFVCNATWTLRKRTCPTRCPETFDEIVPGAACETNPSAQTIAVGCSYFEGTCACIADADAGAPGGSGATVNRPGRWKCAPPPGGRCPAQRPPLGARCVQAMTCDYGSCLLDEALSFSCVDGAWAGAPGPSCP